MLLHFLLLRRLCIFCIDNLPQGGFFVFTMKFSNSIIDSIGNTPLVKLNSVVDDLLPTVLVKIEYFNPGGSIKERMALQIINDAEKSGKLKKGDTIIEATGAGNTGIGLAIIAATRGYHTIFTMPDKNSKEKIDMLKAYGAEVIVCPTNVAPHDPQSYYKVAERLARELPNSFLTKQYSNPSNPLAHYKATGPEIWKQTDGELDYFVAGMGTGGTISGVGKYLKEQSKNVQTIGVDPVGSLYYEYFKHNNLESKAKTYKIEGIGEDFVPETIDFSFIDDVVQVTDKDAYLMARRLAREEGILVGSSSGAAVVGTLQYIREHKIGNDKTFVILLPDSGRSYLSKIYNDEWMQEQGFIEEDVNTSENAEVVVN